MFGENIRVRIRTKSAVQLKLARQSVHPPHDPSRRDAFLRRQERQLVGLRRWAFEGIES